MKDFWKSIHSGTVPPSVRRFGFRGGLALLAVAYLLAFAPPDYTWLDIFNILPGTLAAVLLYLSQGFQKDFLEPFPFSARLGRFMTERYGETRSESFRSVVPRMQDWVRVDFRPEIQMRLFLAGLIGTIVGFGGMWALYAYFKATVYNNYGGNFFLFFQLNIFVCAGFICSIAFSELLRYFIRPSKIPEPPLTVDAIRKFNEDYRNQGISKSLSFDEIFVNLVIYVKLGRYFNYGYGNAEQIRFWQASLLYLHMGIQTLDENAYTLRIRKIIHSLDEKELGLPGLAEGNVEERERIKAFADYWEEAGFSTEIHPYLAYIPKRWRRVWMASVPTEAKGEQGTNSESASTPGVTTASDDGKQESTESHEAVAQNTNGDTKVTFRYSRQIDERYIRDYLERYGPK